MKDLTQFTPKSDGPPAVVVDVTDPIPTDQEVEEGMKEMGLTKITPRTIQFYNRVGVHLKRQGVIHTQRGQAFVPQQILIDTMKQLHNRLSEGMVKADGEKISVEDSCALAREISNAAGKLTESQEFSLRLEAGSPRPPDLPKDAVPSFPAGAIVAAPFSQVTVNQNGGKQEDKPVASPPAKT